MVFKGLIFPSSFRVSSFSALEYLKKSYSSAAASRLPKVKPIPGVKNVVLVSSAKGGVGKSTVAFNIAHGIKSQIKNAKIGILDADVFGPSLPSLTGIHDSPELTKDNKMIPFKSDGLSCMSMGFLVNEGSPIVWRGQLVMKAIQQLIWQTDWGELDMLLVDLPPGTGDVSLSIIQNITIQGSIIVTTPHNLSLADVKRGVALLKKTNIPIFGLVQNMSYFVCPNCQTKTYIFGEDAKSATIASKLGVDLLGDIPLQKQISDSGQIPRSYLDEETADALAQSYQSISQRVGEKINTEE